MDKIDTVHSVHELTFDVFAERVYEHLRLVSAERVSVREDERGIIAREIHDDLGQVLIALRMDLSMLIKKLMGKAENIPRTEFSGEIQRIARLTDNALEALNRLIAELRPEILTHLGLRGAIEWQAHEFQTRTGIPVEIRSDLETITVNDPNYATAVLRIFQEALINVGRHARASRVETTIQENKEFFLMQIKDNGRGINESDLLKTTSFGLLGLKERVFLLHGDVEIQGIPDKGTTVTVRIPLDLCRSSNKQELL